MAIGKSRSKKGRLSGTARRELNNQRVAKVVGGKIEGCAFARVTRMVGFNHVKAAIDASHGAKELIARIPSAFSRRGATPLAIGSIISVFVGAEFDPEDKISTADKFDVIAILNSKQARLLQREGVIPSWMLIDGGEAITVTDGGGFEFEADDDVLFAEGDECDSDLDLSAI